MNSLRTVPLPAYLVLDLKRWKLACPASEAAYVFPGEPDGEASARPSWPTCCLRNVLRRALRKAGLPELRFHDLRHMAASLMSGAGVPIKRAQETLGHASERTTLAIYTHAARRKHDDTADKIAVLAGLAPAPKRKPADSGRPTGDKSAMYGDRRIAQLVEKLAPRVGLEPTTNGLTVRRSTD